MRKSKMRYAVTLFDDAGQVDVIRPRSGDELDSRVREFQNGGCLVIGYAATPSTLHYVMRTSACEMFDKF